MRFDIVDVFAESKYAGNQLAVVHDAGHLSDGQMLEIAREMNFSETTFVSKVGTAEADVRIFTPVRELPFAGHPTLGTAWLLSGGRGEYQLNLAAGPVAVSFVDGVGWMTPPTVSLGANWELQAAAELLNIEVDDIHPDFPVQFASVGPEFVLIGLKRLATLKSVSVNAAAYEKNVEAGLPMRSIFIFSPEAYANDADFAARMFFNTGTMREDPATGSANAAFAAYLQAHQPHLTGQGDIVVDQGVEILRPSRLYLRLTTPLQVGGRVLACATGELT